MKMNQIIHGDSTQLIKTLPDNSVDLIITDPPYKIDNTNAGGNSNFSKSMQKMNDELVDNELNIDLGVEWCREIPKIQKKINCYIWCNKAQIKPYLDYFVTEIGCSWDLIVWQKTNAMPTFNNKYLTDKEYCLYFRKGGYCNPPSYNNAQTVFKLPINVTDKKIYQHPTIKPKQLIKILIENSSKEGDLVADFFGGSGTTGEQAYLLKRNYLLFEKSEKYYKISTDRLKQAQGKVVIKKVDNQMSLPLDT